MNYANMPQSPFNWNLAVFLVLSVVGIWKLGEGAIGWIIFMAIIML